MASDAVLLDVSDLRVHYALRAGVVARLTGRSSGSVKALDGVSLQLRRGEVLGVVGESGSGKTTLARALLGLVDANSGSIRYDGHELVGLSERAWRQYRQRVQMVFQDPHASLNPSMDVATAVGHPLKIHRIARERDDVEERVREALRLVGLTPVERYLGKYPGDLSGGQKQRVVLARAIILRPQLLVADEPVSMLDMSVRAKILELMIGLKAELGLTYVYVTHDLATAKFFCDTIAIMYLGRIVEYGPAEEIYADPKHPYTQALLRAIPEPDPRRSIPRDLPRGEVPDAVAPPLGCSFHPRCPKAFEICGWESRDLRDLFERHWMAQGDADYDHERRVVGDVSALGVPALEADVPAGAGHTPLDVRALLDRIRADRPDEPLWSGVRDVREESGHVRIDFRDDCVDPPLYRVTADGRPPIDVACLLYRPENVSGADRPRG